MIAESGRSAIACAGFANAKRAHSANTTKGYEATQVATHGTAEVRALYDQMHDTKARLFVAREGEQPEIRAEVYRLTETIRKRLREGPHDPNHPCCATTA